MQHEKFKHDLKQKDLEMEEMRHALEEMRKQTYEADEERKVSSYISMDSLRIIVNIGHFMNIISLGFCF